MRTLIVILFILWFNSAFSQDVGSFISDNDLKKLAKAEKYKADADDILAEVNRINLEITNIQTESGSDEKSNNRKVKELESKSIQNQITASALYEKCNEIKFTVYKSYIDEFWEKNPDRESEFLDAKLLEEQAGDNYFQALSYRIEAKRLESYSKIDKLNEAVLLENEALQKQLSALSSYYSIPESKVSDAGNSGTNTADNYESNESLVSDNNLTGNIVVNQEVIDSYNRYMASGQVSDTTISTGKLASVTSFDSDKLLGLWYEYMYGIRDTSKPVSTEMENTVITNAGTSPGNVPDEDDQHMLSENEKETIITGEKGDVLYRVQIAANRSELSQRALSRIYYGTKNVQVVNEDGWYKYSVGDFSTYEEASEFRKSSGISNAFVISYNKESGTEVAKMPGPSSGTLNTTPSANRLPSGLLFRVQIAASRVPVGPDQLSKIYKGSYPVEVVSEDGWYKYQLMGVRFYREARSILNTIGNTGFIVAYDDGIKTPIAGAISKNSDPENEDGKAETANISETEFHVQLAASRKPIPANELAGHYNGPEPVSVIIEDGWYKYHLKAGNSYEAAKKLKQNCKLPGAFIVGYRKAVKINSLQTPRDNFQ